MGRRCTSARKEGVTLHAGITKKSRIVLQDNSGLGAGRYNGHG